MTDAELDTSAAALTQALLTEETTRLEEQAQSAEARVLADGHRRRPIADTPPRQDRRASAGAESRAPRGTSESR